MIKMLPGALRIHVPKKVASGPNIVQPEQKRARYYQQSQSNKLNQVEEEKGGVHVNS